MPRLTVQHVAGLRLPDFFEAVQGLPEVEVRQLRDIMHCRITDMAVRGSSRVHNRDGSVMTEEQARIWKKKRKKARSCLVAMRQVCRTRLAVLHAPAAAAPNGGLMGLIVALLEVAERHEPRDASEAMFLQRARHTVGRSRQAVGA